jgi:hypothetical protein
MVGSIRLSANKIEKILQQRVKTVLASKGLHPSTRSGNKELSLFLTKIARAPFETIAQVQAVGEKLGEKIVELSEQGGKQHLDAATVRCLSFQKDWAEQLGVPQVEVVTPVKKLSTTKQVVVVPPKTEAPSQVEAKLDVATAAVEIVDTAEPTVGAVTVVGLDAEDAPAEMELEMEAVGADTEDEIAEPEAVGVDAEDEIAEPEVEGEELASAVAEPGPDEELEEAGVDTENDMPEPESATKECEEIEEGTIISGDSDVDSVPSAAATTAIETATASETVAAEVPAESMVATDEVAADSETEKQLATDGDDDETIEETEAPQTVKA